MENHESEEKETPAIPGVIPDELARVKKALTQIKIIGTPCFKTENGKPVEIRCTIDTRGLLRQSQANGLIADARKAIEAVSTMQVVVNSTGHAFGKHATVGETVEYLQSRYDY